MDVIKCNKILYYTILLLMVKFERYRIEWNIKKEKCIKLNGIEGVSDINLFILK